MAFDDVLYPKTVTSGAGGPMFSTDITEIGSGHEVANQNWTSSRMMFELGARLVKTSEAVEIIRFFRARRGRARGFRLRDPLDSRSCNPGATPAATDQLLGTGDGAKLRFQLVKSYGDGVGVAESRKITRPVSASVLVAVNNVVVGSGWTVDLTTGIITFTTPPTAGHTVKAGFRFDVPVRFDVDQLLAQTLGNGNVDLPSIPALEIRE